jgi:DNA-binding LytR/AlgR family response regulator
MSISELEAQLDARRFWRIHRSTIVAVASVAAARRDLRGRYRLTLRDRPETLTVSAPYAHLFRQG